MAGVVQIKAAARNVTNGSGQEKSNAVKDQVFISL